MYTISRRRRHHQHHHQLSQKLNPGIFSVCSSMLRYNANMPSLVKGDNMRLEAIIHYLIILLSP